MRTLSAVVVAVAMTGGLAAQEKPAIEVVSIKPTSPDTSGGSFGTRPGGGVLAVGMPMASLISLAYSLPDSNRIEGAPDWFFRERFDVNSTYNGKPARAEEEILWRAVFAERFKLKARLERREVAAFDVVLEKPDQGVPKGLMRIAADCAELRAARQRGETPPTPPPTPSGAPACGGRYSGGTVVSTGMAIQQFVQSIQGGTGRILIDKTGLQGFYEFTLKYASQRPGAPPDPDGAPDLFTALREQLGLKLEPARTMTDYLVIEHIERPTPD